jgi:hypothetical protein
MSGFRSFVRQLGYQPGVQLNPLRDETDGAVLDNADQKIGVIARLSRGRIDRPFRVNKTNLIAKTGLAESMRVNALNEAKLQVYESLNNGTVEAVVQRLTPAAAAKSYAVVNFSGTPTESTETVAFSTSPNAPTAAYSLYVMHHDCFNDGIKIGIHADKTPLGSGTAAPNPDITLRVYDSKNVVLWEISGSLDASAKDDFGKSRYLPDLAMVQTSGAVEVVVATGAQVPITSNAYGRAISGKANWAVSDTLVCFTEGGTTYVADDYDRCIGLMRNTRDAFGYLISGGSQNTLLLGKLGAFGIEANLPTKIDVPGNLTAAAAIAWEQALAFDSHLIHFNYAPIEAEDPMNGGRAVWGAGGLQAGYSCSRNARVNAQGFAPKNYAIAGKEWPLNRISMIQLSYPEENDLSDLAQSQINPVIYDVFNGGGRFVFTDSLTSAKTIASYKKLQNVAEMATTLESWVTLFAKECLQLPMKEFIKRMDKFLARLFDFAQASGWLVPSTNLDGGAAYAYTVKASDVRPADLALIDFWTCFDGTARQVIVQQTLVK